MRAVLFIVYCSFFIPSAVADPVLISDAAMSGWRELRDAARGGLRGTYRYTQIVTVDGAQREPTAYNVEFAVSGEGMVYKEISDGSSRITVWNPQYAFRATSAGDGQPVMDGSLGIGAELDELRTQIRDQWQRLPFGGFEIAGKGMAELVSDPRFNVVSFQQDNLQKRATMVFEPSAGFDGKPRDTALKGGTVQFATDKHWAIESYDCSTVWGQISAKIRYRPFEKTFIPEFREETMVGHGGKSVVHETYQLEEIFQVPSGEHLPVLFADYGLAEPTIKLTEVSSRSSQFALLIIVILIMVFGTYLYLRRRHSAGGRVRT